jgi:hypothetical protein
MTRQWAATNTLRERVANTVRMSKAEVPSCKDSLAALALVETALDAAAVVADDFQLFRDCHEVRDLAAALRAVREGKE